jgi:hypothetical protein
MRPTIHLRHFLDEKARFWALSIIFFHYYKLIFFHIYQLHVLIYGSKFVWEFRKLENQKIYILN